MNQKSLVQKYKNINQKVIENEIEVMVGGYLVNQLNELKWLNNLRLLCKLSIFNKTQLNIIWVNLIEFIYFIFYEKNTN